MTELHTLGPIVLSPVHTLHGGRIPEVVTSRPVELTELTTFDPLTLSPVHTRCPIAFNAVLGCAGLWTGHGLPGIIDGSKIGDEYLDLDSGLLYELVP